MSHLGDFRRYPPGHVDGLVISNNGTNPLFQVDIAVGSARDVDNLGDIEITGTLTADITVSGANGLDTGSEAASTWYSVWVIRRSDTGATAALLSTSSTAPTMPANYNLKRRVGWVRNSSASDFFSFKMIDLGRLRRYTYDHTLAALAVLSAGTDSTFTDVDCSSRMPPTARIAVFNVITGNRGVDMKAKDQTSFDGLGTTSSSSSQREMRVDPDRIIQYKNTAGGGSGTNISLVSYFDRL